MRANINKISKRAKWIIISTTALAFPNFIIFWLVAVSLGGDALNGYVNNNHYFVCAHGACHEVSKSIWTYSYWHASSALFGIFLIFAELALFVTSKDIELEFD